MRLGLSVLPKAQPCDKDSQQTSPARHGDTLSFTNLFQRALLRFPGRITLGRLGMWMVKNGETIQRRYAGWNCKLRMKVEVFPTGHGAHFHVSKKLTEQTILSFEGRNSQRSKQPAYVVEIFDKIAGIKHVYVEPYEITIMWGEVFATDEIVPNVVTTLLKHLPNAA